MTPLLSFDPRTVKAGDVLYSAPGFNLRRHQAEARRAARARWKAAGWKTVRVLLSPEMIARLDARRNDYHDREDVIRVALGFALDWVERKIARRAKRKAERAPKGGAHA